jgi:hypothetical protein
MDKPIEIFDKDGAFTVEFKKYVASIIQEEMRKVTSDGKLDRAKALEYIHQFNK